MIMKKIIKNEFLKRPNADMIIFNVPSLNDKRPTATIKKNKGCINIIV